MVLHYNALNRTPQEKLIAMNGSGGVLRADGRRKDQLRPIKITRNFIKHAEGSVLIEMGDTKVICTASVEDRVPLSLRNKGVGWVTAEYAMLPRATSTRTQRETQRPSGRTQEIQRLIGRSLRAIVDTKLLGERQIFSGIRAAYSEPESLVGRNVVFVANLAPRKMRFGVSEGMILSAGSGGADLKLLDVDAAASPGATVRSGSGLVAACRPSDDQGRPSPSKKTNRGPSPRTSPATSRRWVNPSPATSCAWSVVPLPGSDRQPATRMAPASAVARRRARSLILTSPGPANSVPAR